MWKKKMFYYGFLSAWVSSSFWILCKFVFPTNPNIIKNVPLILFNQGIQSIGLILCGKYLLSDKIYPDSIQTVIAHLSFFLWVEEILFFYVHRLLHYRLFYKWIHFIHHQYRHSYADVALYTHPIEHIICNGIPVIVGPVLLQSDFTTTSIWMTIVITNACYTHSGTNTDDMHDIHHKNSSYNYGVLGLMDQWYGTSLKF
jgi:methylsterol monooxygenase